MFPNNIKLKIGNQEEVSITEEEFEDIADWLRENKYWVSSISYNFPGLDDLSNNNLPFTENVTIVGNTKEWT